MSVLKMLPSSLKREGVSEKTKYARMAFQLLMALSPLIRARGNEVPTSATLCSTEILTDGSRLWFSFQRFHKSQKSVALNTYNAL